MLIKSDSTIPQCFFEGFILSLHIRYFLLNILILILIYVWVWLNFNQFISVWRVIRVSISLILFITALLLDRWPSVNFVEAFQMSARGFALLIPRIFGSFHRWNIVNLFSQVFPLSSLNEMCLYPWSLLCFFTWLLNFARLNHF